jgi:formylmethanofuran dehydrogenase subunit E
MFKFILVAALVWLLFYFFKNKTKLNTVVQCTQCNDTIAKQDATLKNGKYYCSSCV